jgi:hypothetical protein
LVARESPAPKGVARLRKQKLFSSFFNKNKYTNWTLGRIKKKLPQILRAKNANQINSYLGILSHYSAYKITKKMFYEIQGKGGYFTMWMKKWVEWN